MIIKDTKDECSVCGRSNDFTDDNYTARRRVPVPSGRSVHFGCLGPWLVKDALERVLPGASYDERMVIALRLGLGHADSPRWRDLEDIVDAAKTDPLVWWSTKARASQLQTSAMGKFERHVEKEMGREERSPVITDADADRVLAEAVRRGIAPQLVVAEALDALLGPPRRTLAFVGLGDGAPGFRAADSEGVLSKEFGS